MVRPLAAVVLLFLTGTFVALAQSPSSSAETNTAAEQSPFAAYHTELDRAADNALGDSIRRMAAAARDHDSSLQPSSPDSLIVGFDQRFRHGPRPSLGTAMRRLDQLRPMIELILQTEGIPLQLASVIVVESGGRADARSPKGARGLWQLMPETARRYGLEVTATADERLDAEKSTHAAARYLRDLYQQFGSWPLALAGYNVGEQALQRAVARSGTLDFVQLSSLRLLPQETRNYVPAVLSAMQLLGNQHLPGPPITQTRSPQSAPVFAVPGGQP